MPTHREILRDMGFGQAICDHLHGRSRYWSGPQRTDLHPSDISDVDVRWDNGDRYDPECDYEHTPPELSVRVTFQPLLPGSLLAEQYPDRQRPLTLDVDPAWALEHLMKSLLGLSHA